MDVATRSWPARGLAAGLLAAILLALAEWAQVTALDPSPLQGAGEALRFVAASVTVFGFVTLPLGLGFGLSLLGMARWLDLPASWHRLHDDEGFRRRHETHLAGLAAFVPVAVLTVAAGAFAVQRTFVRHMNNPTLGAAFMALSVIGLLVVVLSLTGVGVVTLGAVVVRLRLDRLARQEPRYLRATLRAVGALAIAGLATAFALLYNPEVWSPTWVAYLLGVAALPIGLALIRPLIAWARIFRSVAAAGSLVLAYLALTAWTFTGLNTWEGPKQAILSEATFTPTLAGLIHRLTDRDGDGQSALLGGGDCDDGNAAVYAGALEIPGNGLDDNCLGGDAPPIDELPADQPPAGADANEGTGAGTGQAAVVEPPPDRRKNIVILLVDTLRPDHLGFFGYERNLSPSMDALAAESLVFERTYAQGPRTPMSIPSIFTSRFTGHLDLENPTHNYPDLRASNLTLFEVLHELGYFTLAVTSHYYFERSPGMQQGFEHFDNRGALSISETNTVSAAPDIFAHLEEHLPALSTAEEPFCLFVHYYEPHSRWMPHPEVVDFGEASGRQRHIDNYDSEIAFVDQYVGRTLDALREHGLYDDTIVVLVSDHGEAFNEHGHYFHGQTLYQEVIRVPFFLRVPGLEPRRITTPVSLLDLAPTLLALNGAPIPREFEGRALPLDGEPIPVVDIFSELLPYSNYDEHLTALVRGDLKLIYQVTRRRFELYDLAQDPGEQENIYREHPQADALEQRLTQWMETGR